MRAFSGPDEIPLASSFIAALHGEGKRRAEQWLDSNFHLIEAKSSCTLEQILG